jgi:glutathione S-transferase
MAKGRGYVLYGGAFTRASLVEWVLQETEAPYELRQVDILAGENRRPEYLALNPSGLVPVLVTPEGEALTETAALLLYLADRHRLADLAPLDGDPLRGAFLSAVFFIASDLQPEMKRFHYPHRFALREDDIPAVQAQAAALVLTRLGLVEERLGRQGPYLLGTRFSLADVYLCFWIAYLDHAGVAARYPRLGRLYDLVRDGHAAGRILRETEEAARAYGELMARKPTGVIA